MVSANIIKTNLIDRFGNAEEPSPKIFRVLEQHRDCAFSIKYFDYSKSFLSDNFDLDSYQDYILSDDYYKNSGSLQWNYYLHFICSKSEYEELKNSGKIHFIEGNRSYARKRIIIDTELENVIASYSKKISNIDGDNIPDDLGSIWTNSLISCGLESIIDKSIPYTRIVDSYLNDIHKKPLDATSQDTAEHKHSLTNIQSIKINRFRQYPKIDKIGFEKKFGLVNLIEGPNGTGKTSLFEAIEVWTCGKTFRDKENSIDISNIDIDIRFEGNEYYTPNNKTMKVFRERDLEWYGNYEKKQNNLHTNFSRYNFFDTDSAARMSILNDGDNAGNLYDALADLIFGQYVNILEERIDKSLPRFQSEFRSTENEIKEIKKNIKSEETRILQYKNLPDDTKQIYDDFINDIKVGGWLADTPKSGKSFIVKFSRLLEDDLESLKNLEESVYWVRNPVPSILNEAYKSLIEAKSKLTRIHKEEDVIRKKIETHKIDLDEIVHHSTLVSRYSDYIKNENIELITSIDRTIQTLQQKIDINEQVLSDINDIDLTHFMDEKGSLKGTLERLQKEAKGIEHEYQSKDRMRKEMEAETDKSVSLLADLKQIAKDILAHDKNRHNCPLCGSKYQPGELATKIEDIDKKDMIPEGLTAILKEISISKDKIKKLKNDINCYSNMKCAIEILMPKTNIEEIATKKAVNLLSSLPDAVTNLKKELKELNSILKLFKSNKFTREEYLELLRYINKIDDKNSLNLKSKDGIKQYLDIINKKRETEIESISKHERKLQELEKSCLIVIQSEVKRTSSLEDESEIHERIDVINEFNIELNEYINCYKFAKEQPINSLSTLIKKLSITTSNYLKTIDRLEEGRVAVKSANSEIKRLTNLLPDIKNKNNKLNAAITALDKILKSYGKKEYIEKFFATNKIEIKNTFLSIHAPQEFSDISITDNQIKLIRKINKKECTIDQISSGQRSALALAIFLTMNRKIKKGAPPFILFDDPIVFVDELNLLSFFDYLRDIVIEGGRQIFFATANPKIGSLFRKKFDFLGKEKFQDLILSR